MRIDIIGKKYNVSQHLYDVIEMKLAKFDKYFDDSVVATVICKSETKGKYAMELTIKFTDGNILRAEVSSDNMYCNIDLVLPKIERQIRKYKTRLENKLKRTAFDESFIYGDDDETPPIPVVTKKKKIDLATITVQDAVSELDLVGNDFYIFVNSEVDRVNVLYKRKDGDLGLIDLKY